MGTTIGSSLGGRQHRQFPGISGVFWNSEVAKPRLPEQLLGPLDKNGRTPPFMDATVPPRWNGGAVGEYTQPKTSAGHDIVVPTACEVKVALQAVGRPAEGWVPVPNGAPLH